MSNATILWAMGARKLSPPAKLVLILAGDACDMDGRVFDLEALADQANVTAVAFADIVKELALAGFAVGRTAVNPIDGAPGACIELLCEAEVLLS